MVHPIHSGSFTVPIHWWVTTPSSKQVTLVVKQTIELEKDKSKRCCFEKQQNSVPKGYTLMPSKCTYTLMFTFCHFRQNKRDKVVTRLQLKDITLNLRSRSHVEKGSNYFTWKTEHPWLSVLAVKMPCKSLICANSLSGCQCDPIRSWASTSVRANQDSWFGLHPSKSLAIAWKCLGEWE